MKTKPTLRLEEELLAEAKKHAGRLGNGSDFRCSKIGVVTPDEFLAIVSSMSL